MKHPRYLMPASIAIAGLAIVLGLSTSAWAAANLDPFARNLRGNALSPFRTAQAEAEPAAGAGAEEKKAAATSLGGSQVDKTPSQPVAATSAPTAAKAGGVCSRDEECAVGTICEHGVCQAFERSTNLLLFRKEGANLNVIPLYWSRRGNPGYRVVAPLYWHFWSPQAHTRIVFPFYWRVEDHLKQRVVTVVGLYSHTRQPDARSWAVWPFVYVSTKFGWAAPLLGSFTIGDPDKGHSLGLLGFLYFWTRSGHNKFDVCPLFISSRSAESSFTYALPLNFHWRNQEGTNLLILPVGLRHTTRTGGYFASLLGYSSVEGESKTGAFFWLYWFGRSKTDNYDVGFPLLWSFRSPESNTTIVPPVFHIRRGGWSLGSAALLAWWGSNKDKGSSWQFTPLYFGSQGDHGKTALYLTPLGGYKRDDKAGSHNLTWIVPPILRWHDPQSELNSYLLLYWHYRDLAANSNTVLAGLYYRRTDPAGSTTGVFPLFWHFNDRAHHAKAHTFLPFYFHRQSPDERSTVVGLGLWPYWRRFSDGGHSAGVFPFVFSGQRGDRSHLIVAPFYWHFRDQRSSTTAALPLWYHTQDATSAHTGILPLLYFSGHDHEASYRFQIPLFWHFADSLRGTSTTIAPLFFHNVDQKGSSSGVIPLAFWGSGSQSSHFVFFPLFWRFRDDAADRSTTVVGNFLHSRWGGETTDAFFPLLHYRRGAHPGGQDGTSFTFFPIAHYRRDNQSTLFASILAAWTRRPGLKAGFVLPYFWYRSHTVDAQGVPLLYLDHTLLSTGQRTRMFGPYVMVDSPKVTARSLFPLYARYWENGEVGTYIFPLYFGRCGADGSRLDSFLPLFWSSRGPNHRSLMVGPWFHTRNDKKHSQASGLVPLFVSTNNPWRRWLVTPLFVYHRNHETQTSQVVSPLFFQFNRPDGGTRVAFPFWWQGHQGPKSYAVGFPLYWHFANREEQSAFTLAGPFLWSHQGSEYTRGLMPLLWYSRDRVNETASHAFLPFFYERHGRQSQTLATPLFGWGKGPDRLWWYAGLLIWRDNWKSRFSALAPLMFSHHDKVTDTTTRVIPPLLHYSRTSPERSLSTTLLLYWHRSNVTSSTTLGLPLFYDIHAYQESRLTMFVPLYLRYSNEISQNTYHVAPLFYRRSSPTDASTIAFPLYWRFWSPERSTTVVFPFYFGFRRPTWTGSYIFPSIWFSKGLGPEAGTSHFWFVPFWESQVKRPGDYMWEALLGVLGWERIGRSRFLKVLFIPFELEPVAPAKTAWYGRTPKRSAARGLNTQVW